MTKTSRSLRLARKNTIQTDSQETIEEYRRDVGTLILLPFAPKMSLPCEGFIKLNIKDKMTGYFLVTNKVFLPFSGYLFWRDVLSVLFIWLVGNVNCLQILLNCSSPKMITIQLINLKSIFDILGQKDSKLNFLLPVYCDLILLIIQFLVFRT